MVPPQSPSHESNVSIHEDVPDRMSHIITMLMVQLVLLEIQTMMMKDELVHQDIRHHMHKNHDLLQIEI